MRALVRDLFGFTLIYVVGVVATFGWIVIGMYIYFRPLPPNSLLDTEFNHDVGTALVAQGLIFFVPFAVALLIRIIRGNHEQEELKKDRQMLREIYQWMLEEKSKNNGALPATTSNQQMDIMVAERPISSRKKSG